SSLGFGCICQWRSETTVEITVNPSKGRTPAMLARFANQGRSRPDTSTSRALFVAAVIVFWMLAISVRLVFLQVSKHERLVDRARQQQQDAVETTPQRGCLLDRQGRELARSVDTVSLFVAPDEVSDDQSLERLVQTVSGALKLNPKPMMDQLQEAKSAGRRFVWIVRRVEATDANKLLS